MNDIKIKHCVGILIYNCEGKIYLMRSPKWRNTKTGKFGEVWTVPGGEIEVKTDGSMETLEEAVNREIKEELKISLRKIEYISHHTKPPSNDFIKENVHFEFEDFIAASDTSEVMEDTVEIISDEKPKWFTIEEVERLPMNDTCRDFFLKTKEKLRERILELQAESYLDKR